jgi:hypothetical protein
MNRRLSEDNVVARARTRVIINMALDITVVLGEGESAILDRINAQTTEPKQQRSRSLPGNDKIKKPNKLQQTDKKHGPKKFIFIDEVCTFGNIEKTMVEKCDYNKKKSIPGFDELSKMFKFR